MSGTLALVVLVAGCSSGGELPERPAAMGELAGNFERLAPPDVDTSGQVWEELLRPAFTTEMMLVEGHLLIADSLGVQRVRFPGRFQVGVGEAPRWDDDPRIESGTMLSVSSQGDHGDPVVSVDWESTPRWLRFDISLPTEPMGRPAGPSVSWGILIEDGDFRAGEELAGPAVVSGLAVGEAATGWIAARGDGTTWVTMLNGGTQHKLRTNVPNADVWPPERVTVEYEGFTLGRFIDLRLVLDSV